MVREVRNYLSKKGKANLEEISFYLKFDKEMVRHALFLLKTKNLILAEEMRSPCQSCSSSCSSQGTCSEPNIIYSLK